MDVNALTSSNLPNSTSPNNLLPVSSAFIVKKLGNFASVNYNTPNVIGTSVERDSGLDAGDCR